MTSTATIAKPQTATADKPPTTGLRQLLTNGVAGLATVLTGLCAGIFVAWEVTVTNGLAHVGDVTYVDTFQTINANIRNFWFAVVFFGSVLALAARAALPSSRAVRALSLSALGLQLTGLAITFAGNVPLNNQLADAELSSAAAAVARADFESPWNTLNLIRTVVFVGAFVVILAAGLADRRGANNS